MKAKFTAVFSLKVMTKIWKPQGRGEAREYAESAEFDDEDIFLNWVAEQKTWQL